MGKLVFSETEISLFGKTFEKTKEGIKETVFGTTFIRKQLFFAGELYDGLRQHKASPKQVIIGDDLAQQIYFDDKSNLQELLLANKFYVDGYPSLKEWEWTTRGASVEAVMIRDVEIFDRVIPLLIIVDSSLAPSMSAMGPKTPILKIEV